MRTITHTFTVQKPMQTVWDMFTCPQQMQTLFPRTMRWSFAPDTPEQITSGSKLVWTMYPFWIFPVHWVGEITEYTPYASFADRQIAGPYAHWNHMRVFTETINGVTVTDTIHYELPFGVLNGVIDRMLVRPRFSALYRFRDGMLSR